MPPRKQKPAPLVTVTGPDPAAAKSERAGVRAELFAKYLLLAPEVMSELFSMIEDGDEEPVHPGRERFIRTTVEQVTEGPTNTAPAHCIGWPTIALLADKGEHIFSDGYGLIAASDLFRWQDVSEIPPDLVTAIVHALQSGRLRIANWTGNHLVSILGGDPIGRTPALPNGGYRADFEGRPVAECGTESGARERVEAAARAKGWAIVAAERGGKRG